jgi:hypothetical protein
MANKSKKKHIDSISFYPHKKDRHVTFDWASVAMHMLHAPESGKYIKESTPISMQCTGIYYDKSGYYVSFGNDKKIYHITKENGKLVRNINADLPETVTSMGDDWGSKLSQEITDYIMHIEAAEWQCNMWVNKMYNEVLSILNIFNPKHVTIALEGRNTWRHDVYNEYYSREGKVKYLVCDNLYSVRYDLKEILLVTDGNNNITNVVDKGRRASKVKNIISGKIEYESIVGDSQFTELDEVPRYILDYSVDNIIPTYKGNRKKTEWEFAFSKSEWGTIRDECAKSITKYINANVVQHDKCEGDDIVHLSIKEYMETYSDTILVTRDSDMNQLLDEKRLAIYNHHDRCMQPRLDSHSYLMCKILSGDTADNIPGMILPGKTSKIADGKAPALFESCEYNPYKVAEDEGWVDQFLRNKKLIDLSEVPVEIIAEVKPLFNNTAWLKSTTTFDYALNNMCMNRITKMIDMGFYCFNEGDTEFKGKKYESVILASQLNNPDNMSITSTYNQHQNQEWVGAQAAPPTNQWITNGNPAESPVGDGAWSTNTEDAWVTNGNPAPIENEWGNDVW